MMPSRDLRGSRRDVALALRDGPKTANEVGKALGRKTGAIFGVIKRMHAEGLLEATPDPPARGTKYALAEGVRVSLDDGGSETHGRLVRHQALLLVKASSVSERRKAAEVFADAELTIAVDWAARLSDGWLIAISADLENDVPLERIANALAERGLKSREVHVRDVTGRTELRFRSEQTLEGSGL